MDLSATLAAINNLSIEDRIRLVQEIWDGIDAEQAAPPLSEPQRRELERRCAELDANPEIGIPWEQVKARTQERLRP
ncbi:MAG: addiction module protein [Planctomycetia bacterium]|nr:addiction module protein [Planctomycetia bacterium]